MDTKEGLRGALPSAAAGQADPRREARDYPEGPARNASRSDAGGDDRTQPGVSMNTSKR
jgi:hypothetical protein